MGELFGLGILLTLQDRATNGVHVATHALEDLEDQTRDVINAVSDLDRANTGLSSSNPSMTLTEMAQSMRQYTYYYDQYGRRHRYHSNHMPGKHILLHQDVHPVYACAQRPFPHTRFR